MSTGFEIISWAGVGLLTAAQVSLSVGASKRTASALSASGGFLALIAAAGLGIWPIVMLNIFWITISLRGTQVDECRQSQGRALLLMSGMSLSCLVCRLSGPTLVQYAVYGTYIAGWVTFAGGRCSRRFYLLSSAVAGFCVVPALLSEQAYAFAINEGIGAAISAAGVIRLRGVAPFMKKPACSTERTG